MGSSETLLWLGSRPFHSEHLQGHHKVWSCCFNPRLSQEAFQSQNSVFNTPRQNEAVATDTVFSDTPPIADGSTMVQFSVAETPWSVMHMASGAPSN